MKGCENLLNSGKLSRLEKKFYATQKKQEEALARMRQEKNEIKKAMESERFAFIIRTIKQTGFPIDKPAILIGAILAAKEKLDSTDSAVEIDHYIELYTAFAEKHVSTEEGDEGDEIDKYPVQEKEVIKNGGDR